MRLNQITVTGLIIFFTSSVYAGPHQPPPHGMIEQAYFKCEDSKSLEGGIYGKGPFKKFGPEDSACSSSEWQSISLDEFRKLATQWYEVNWSNEIAWWNRADLTGKSFRDVLGTEVSSREGFCQDIPVSGAVFDQRHLFQHLTRLTGLNYPEGTKWLGYFNCGSGMDTALAAKLEIPEYKKEEFLQNDVFKKGRDEFPIVQIGRTLKWWQVDSLHDRIDRTLQLPDSSTVECSLGYEENKLIVYISWWKM
jgi:hypothetical protein